MEGAGVTTAAKNWHCYKKELEILEQVSKLFLLSLVLTLFFFLEVAVKQKQKKNFNSHGRHRCRTV